MINKQSLELIKSFEGLYLNAYPDPATKNDPIKKGEPITIAYGTTVYPDGTKVKMGDTCTEQQAEQYLAHDVNKFYNKVQELVKSMVNDNQIGAITSFAYNVGLGNLKSSTLLKMVNNNPNDKEIDKQFMRWNKAAGKVMNGLTRRRAAESKLYFSPM